MASTRARRESGGRRAPRPKGATAWVAGASAVAVVVLALAVALFLVPRDASTERAWTPPPQTNASPDELASASATPAPPAAPYPESPPPPSPSTTAAPSPTSPPAPARLVPRVVAAYPHDREAFTQGLLWHAGALYESTGLYGRSTLRRVALVTGAVERRVDLPPRLFGEGLARVGDRLVQLTWQEEVALVWDLATFAGRAEHRYAGEGWGLCYDGRRLVRSDGSDRLTLHDPESFATLGELAVTVDGRPAALLNELECVDGVVWANVLGSDDILRIDGASGRATAVVDASRLLSPLERGGADVLNGIAHRPETGTFLLTGKLWPKLFEVVLEPAP